MLVFTENAVANLHRRFGNRPNHRQPDLYRIATHPAYTLARSEIEDWVAKIPDDERRTNIVGSLLSGEHFWNTWSELRTGDLLRQLGHNIEYHRPIPNVSSELTPDWYIYPSQGKSEFFVEVFTPNPPKQRIENKNKWRDLCRRIEKLALGYGLSVQAPEDCVVPDESRAKLIIQKIGDWLTNFNPITDEILYLDCVTLAKVYDEYKRDWLYLTVKVCEKSDEPSVQNTWCLEPINLYKIDVSSLKKNILLKIAKYGKTLEETGTPFFVGVLPHPESLFSPDSIHDAIFGELVTRIYNASNQNEKFWRYERLSNGLFKDNKALSGLIWVQKHSKDSAPATTYFNPTATHPFITEALNFGLLKT